MFRERICCGAALMAFGVGILVSLLLSSGLCLFFMAGVSITVGIILVH